MSETIHSYDDKNIQVLSPLDAIRKRPGMYISDTEFVAYKLGCEGYENAFDEVKAGYATKVRVILSEKNGRITIIDNGRGIPIGINSESGMSTLKAIFTIPHSGGKFEDSAYGGTSGGLHGIGITAANALSRELDVITYRDGKKRHLHTEHSVSCYWDDANQSWVKDPEYDPPAVETGDLNAHGTEISFIIDHTIPSLEGYGRVFPVETTRHRLQQLAFLNLGAIVEFTYEQGGETVTQEFCYKTWKEYFDAHVRKIDSDEEVYTPEYIFIDHMNEDNTGVQALLCFSSGYARNIHAFTNTILNQSGGRHVIGLERAIYSAFFNYGFTDDEGNPYKFEENDLCRGINGILSIYIKDAKYGSQTKERLTTKTAESFVQGIVELDLRKWIFKNQEIANKLCHAAAMRYNTRRNSERNVNLAKAVQINDAPSGSKKPIQASNYVECHSLDATRCELFIVEGDSASGLMKKGRDKNHQAIMLLKGKVLNSARVNEERMLAHKELSLLGTVIGAGLSDLCDPSKSRFQKIIITTDADSDGAHIRTLLQGFFGIYTYPLLEAGYIYVVAPPLYGATQYAKYKDYTAFGNSKLELIKEIEELPDTSSLLDLGEAEIAERLKGWDITRYKGLGEMSAEQTAHTILNKDTRLLRQLTVSDLDSCMQSVNEMMGKPTWYRKQALGGVPVMTSFEEALQDRPLSPLDMAVEEVDTTAMEEMDEEE
ncbi:toprim domain-containing protein [Ewingella americana]|uniref:DNA gyrase subunit B n=1 Tax=Ewingella americana TaxID=41202 RepID=A0A502GDT6_9GAMM|nr:toprim domain-containing protein [Ewingella americana]TPG60075.1 hypothetical protein EAH77_16030 [Ewingella americana]